MLLNLKMESFRWPICADELRFNRNSILINIPLHEQKERGLQISQEFLNEIAIQYQVHLHDSSFHLNQCNIRY